MAETLSPMSRIALAGGGYVKSYREGLESDGEVVEQTADGEAVVVSRGTVCYLGAWLDHDALRRVVERACRSAGIETLNLPDGVRVRDSGRERFWFNYDSVEHRVGDLQLAPASVVRPASAVAVASSCCVFREE